MRTLIVLVATGWLLLMCTAPALANCTTQTLVMDGKYKVCQTCCFAGSCQTTCY